MNSMVPQKNAIHAVPSACSRCPPVGSGFERSKIPMLSSPRKPPPNRLFPSSSFRFTHQVKLMSSLWNARSRKIRSRCAARAGHAVHAVARPRVNRRVHVIERELVRRQLPVRVHVPLAEQQQQLALREFRVDRARTARRGTRDPTPRTTDTPTCPAPTSRRARGRDASRRCVPLGAPRGGGGWPGSPSSQSFTT